MAVDLIGEIETNPLVVILNELASKLPTDEDRHLFYDSLRELFSDVNCDSLCHGSDLTASGLSGNLARVEELRDTPLGSVELIKYLGDKSGEYRG